MSQKLNGDNKKSFKMRASNISKTETDSLTAKGQSLAMEYSVIYHRHLADNAIHHEMFLKMIDRYIEDDAEDSAANPLQFWKMNVDRFPYLSQLSKTCFAIQA